MPPVPENTTGAMTVKYSGPLGTHQMTFHQVLGSSIGDFTASVRAIITQMTALQFSNVNWYEAFYRQAGQNFSLPVTGWTTISSSGTRPSPTTSDTNGEYLNFAGRSPSTGVRARLFLYSVPGGPTTSMRITGASNAGVASVITQLNSGASTVGAIDGTQASWKLYTNVGFNDYWVRRSRISS